MGNLKPLYLTDLQVDDLCKIINFCRSVKCDDMLVRISASVIKKELFEQVIANDDNEETIRRGRAADETAA